MRNGKSKYVLMKDVIVHRINNVTTVIITMTKIYMRRWHVCLIMINFLVEFLVTVCN